MVRRHRIRLGSNNAAARATLSHSHGDHDGPDRTDALRCLAPALLTEARAHPQNPAGLDQAVARLLNEPITTLFHLIEGEPWTRTRDGVELDSARAVTEGTRLLVHALQSALYEAPILEGVMMRLTAISHETPAETDAVEAAAQHIAELLESDGRPGDAADPIAVHRCLRAMCRLPDPRH